MKDRVHSAGQTTRAGSLPQQTSVSLVVRRCSSGSNPKPLFCYPARCEPTRGVPGFGSSSSNYGLLFWSLEATILTGRSFSGFEYSHSPVLRPASISVSSRVRLRAAQPVRPGRPIYLLRNSRGSDFPGDSPTDPRTSRPHSSTTIPSVPNSG